MTMRHLVLFFCLATLSSIGLAAASKPPAPSASLAPADGIRSLLAGLEQAEQASHRDQKSLEGCLVCLSEIGSELDMFELQYGVRPAEAPDWTDMKNRAAALLKRLEARPKEDLYFNRDSADVGMCVLLELSGREDEALARLDTIQPGGGCGNWIATVMQSVEQRRTGIYERKGDYKSALEHEETACGYDGISLYSPAADLDAVRHGFLLEKMKRSTEAIPFYQWAVDLCPKTKGAELATQRLTALHALVVPSAQRIVHVYIEPSQTGDYDRGIFALAEHGFPESYDLLAAQLKTAKDWRRNRVIPALGELGDKRAIPLLHGYCSPSSDSANRIQAVAALHHLGDDSEIAPLLAAAAQSDNTLDQQFIDSMLRSIYGDGPKLDPWKAKPAEFSRVWERWIGEYHQPAKSA